MNTNFTQNAEGRHFQSGACLSRIMNHSGAKRQTAATLAGSPLLNAQLRPTSLVVGLVLPKGSVCSFYPVGRAEKDTSFFKSEMNSKL